MHRTCTLIVLEGSSRKHDPSQDVARKRHLPPCSRAEALAIRMKQCTVDLL